MSVQSRQERKPAGPAEPPVQDLFDLDLALLDKHCLQQPKLVYEYGMKLADARDALDRSKASYDLAKAEAANQISKSPETFGLSKTTDAAIKAAVETHEDVMAAQDRLQKQTHAVAVLQAVMNALEHRKRALEGLIQLHGQQYFAAPSVTAEQRRELEGQTKAAVRSRRFEPDDD